MTDWLFWVIAAAVAFASLGLVFAPLLRRGGRAPARAEYDARVFRDQLREIESDRARGILGDTEAEASRIEVSRRLIAAADAAVGDAGTGEAPPSVSRRTAPIAVAALVVVAGGIYAALGSPGLPDDPLKARLAREAEARANRPKQAEVEAMVADRGLAPPVEARPEDAALVEKLEQVMKERPDDVDGQRLLARSLASLGRWSEARAAEEKLVALLGDRAAAQDHVDLAELSVLAAGGYVSPEAEAALARALALDPQNPVGRYYSGLALLQGGRPDLAYRLWTTLLAEGPADAPWIAAIRSQIGEAAGMAGLPPPEGTAPGPAAGDIEAAQSMTPEDRQQMVEGMVAQLSERLATQGGPPEDWARLVRSLGVLGRRAEAAAVLAEAREKHAGDAAALALIDRAASEAGVAP
jgi:cytochrome c-type biogenesis protein CcmH